MLPEKNFFPVGNFLRQGTIVVLLAQGEDALLSVFVKVFAAIQDNIHQESGLTPAG